MTSVPRLWHFPPPVYSMFLTSNLILCTRSSYRIHKWRNISSWVQLVPRPRHPSASGNSQHHSLEQRISSARLEKKRFYSSQDSQSPNVVFSDPYRPGLFYHLLNPPTPLSRTLPAFGLSFLHRTPPSVNSAVVIGWLPAQKYGSGDNGVAGANSSQSQENETSLQDFRANRKFLAVWSPLSVLKFLWFEKPSLLLSFTMLFGPVWPRASTIYGRILHCSCAMVGCTSTVRILFYIRQPHY